MLGEKMTNKILIIEDDIAIAETIKAYLSKHGTFAVTIKKMGSDGLKTFENEDFDLVLLDLNLPDQYGFSILTKINTLNPKCKVIVITGETSTTIAVEAIKHGAYDFVSKPISSARLNICVRNALNHVHTIETNKEKKYDLNSIRPLKICEKETIELAIQICGGNISEAAKRLDINPATIHRKRKQWGENKN